MEVPSILTKLEHVRKTGGGWQARCPAHEDRQASLSVSTGDDGRVLLHCHAGCTRRGGRRQAGSHHAGPYAERQRQRQARRQRQGGDGDRRHLRLPGRARRVALSGRPHGSEGLPATQAESRRRVGLVAKGGQAGSVPAPGIAGSGAHHDRLYRRGGEGRRQPRQAGPRGDVQCRRSGRRQREQMAPGVQPVFQGSSGRHSSGQRQTRAQARSARGSGVARHCGGDQGRRITRGRERRIGLV